MSSHNEAARAFTKLHVPGRPVILTNVWDAVSANAVAKLPECEALATPSYGVAATIGLDDNDLTLDQNLYALKGIAKVAQAKGKPLTADMQDGYGERLEECIKSIIALGIVGLNLEDADKEKGKMYSIDEGANRVKRARAAAAEAGVPDLHINARCDTLLHGGTVDDAIARGKAYLAAGAATVFVWGGGARGGISREEVEQLCKGLDGKLNVSMRVDPTGNLTVADLSNIGVARISIGPGLQIKTSGYLSQEAAKLLRRP